MITDDGSIDLAKVPIEAVLVQAMSRDPPTVRSALSLLSSMQHSGRDEAGEFLMGLLVSCDDDWHERSQIVNSLRWVHSEPCARLLFGELKRVESSNTNRRYLTTVIDVLASMPPRLVIPGFISLAEDKSFSYRMRKKFEEVRWRLES